MDYADKLDMMDDDLDIEGYPYDEDAPNDEYFNIYSISPDENNLDQLYSTENTQ